MISEISVYPDYEQGCLLAGASHCEDLHSFRFNDMTWQDFLFHEDSKITLIYTHTGEKAQCSPHSVYCAGAIDACQSHIIFDAIEVYLKDVRLYLNVNNDKVTVWSTKCLARY